MKAQDIKNFLKNENVDVCGIAGVNSFGDAPNGYHPKDILSEANSVIVYGIAFSLGAMVASSTVPYTILRNRLSAINDDIGIRLSFYIERDGALAVPTGAIGPCEWDHIKKRTRGILSLKHSAVLAGLGKIGKNTLLINKQFGNRLWLGAVVTSFSLESDSPADYDVCPQNCTICVDNCPVKALRKSKMNQKACWDYAFGIPENGGEWRVKCFQCRKGCPQSSGVK